MKLQTLIRSSEPIEDVNSFLRERYPERFSLMENWQELNINLGLEKLEEDKYVVYIEIPDEEFGKLTSIFPSKDEAVGAFLTTAMESGWEMVPDSYVVYHAQFEGDRLIAGIKTEEGISKHDQLHLEEMIQKMSGYRRVIVYSSDVLTYIKDLFPDVDSRAYVISREIAKRVGSAPELEDLGKIYGIDISSLEGKLELIDRLVKGPVKLPEGEVEIKPYHYPLEA